MWSVSTSAQLARARGGGSSARGRLGGRCRKERRAVCALARWRAPGARLCASHAAEAALVVDDSVYQQLLRRPGVSEKWLRPEQGTRLHPVAAAAAERAQARRRRLPPGRGAHRGEPATVRAIRAFCGRRGRRRIRSQRHALLTGRSRSNDEGAGCSQEEAHEEARISRAAGDVRWLLTPPTHAAPPARPTKRPSRRWRVAGAP